MKIQEMKPRVNWNLEPQTLEREGMLAVYFGIMFVLILARLAHLI